MTRGFLEVVAMVLVAWLVVFALSSWAWSQESPKQAVTPNQPVIQKVMAADGSELIITTVTGSWAACRMTTQYWEQAALRGSEKWYTRMQEFEAKNSCVTASQGDLVLVGPSNVAGTLVVAFRDRKDVRSALAWYVSCAAVPVAEAFCFHD
jgi:hypothetical protein